LSHLSAGAASTMLTVRPLAHVTCSIKFDSLGCAVFVYLTSSGKIDFVASSSQRNIHQKLQTPEQKEIFISGFILLTPTGKTFHFRSALKKYAPVFSINRLLM
jgi:hypothetical protein